jgi:hypothetical protein
VFLEFCVVQVIALKYGQQKGKMHQVKKLIPAKVHSTALGAFKRTHGRTQEAAVEHMPSQP